MNFAKFLRTPFLQNTSGRLLLHFYEPQLFQVFVPWKFIKTQAFPCLQKQPTEVFCKKSVLRNLAKTTGKDLCQSLIFKKRSEACNFIKKKRFWLAQVSTITFRVNSHADNHFYKYICLFQHKILKFFFLIKIHVKVFRIQI